MTDPLLAHRPRFPILSRTNYLISNSLGAMPAAARDAVSRYAETWATRGVRAWADEWWDMPRQVGDGVGRIIGAGRGEVAMHVNVTSAAAVVLSCFDWTGRRNGLLATDMNFPSLLYLYQAHRSAGLRLVEVKSPDGVRVDTEQVVDAIDDTIQIVALDHVLFRSAFVQDAKTITEAAHARGAYVLLDAFQSAGTVPVDVKALDVDFAVGGALKWLCGGPGACYLWVNPRIAGTLTPRITGWMAHEEPFAFDVGPLRARGDAYRFMNGTPNVPGLEAARCGIEIVGEVGVAAIRAKSVRQTARLVELARASGFRTTCPEDPARRGGTVAIDVPHGKAVCQELLAREILVDYRPQAGVRVSPHFYTSDDELEACVDAMDDILRTKAWERHAGGLPSVG